MNDLDGSLPEACRVARTQSAQTCPGASCVRGAGGSARRRVAALRATALRVLVLLIVTLVPAGQADPVSAASEGPGGGGRDHLKKARVFLAAGDYRRALEACQRQLEESPSAESYVYLTYVYQTIDGYLEHLAATDRWVKVEQLYLNLAASGTQDLVDPPDVLARIAKEIIQGSARQQSDVSAAMAARLDEAAVARLWKQQTAWRAAKPDGWWAGVPEGWNW